MENRARWPLENRIRVWILLEEKKAESNQTDFRTLLNGESREERILRYLKEIGKESEPNNW